MKNLTVILAVLFPILIQAQIITTVAGNGTVPPGSPPIGDGGPATAAQVDGPIYGGCDALGNYFFGEGIAAGPHPWYIVVRKIDTAGIISTVAGSLWGFVDNVMATVGQMRSPEVKVDLAGNIYVADIYNSRIRKIDAGTNIIHTIAGTGVMSSGTGDGGPATAATVQASIVCPNNAGNIFIADAYSIRKINEATGIISLVAPIRSLGGICFDKMGKLYISLNDRIIKLDTSTGHIDTIAGTGITMPYNGDGIPATNANLNPADIAVDSKGTLYIADYRAHRVRTIDANGYIHTFAGNGGIYHSGDGGSPDTASIPQPRGLAFDPCGDLYIAEYNYIRKVTFPHTSPSIAIAAVSSVPIGSLVTVTATVTTTGGYNIKWFKNGLWFSTTASPVNTTSYTKTAGDHTITAKIITTATKCMDSSTSREQIISETIMGTPFTNQVIRENSPIYPSPTKGILILENANQNQVHIYNAIGKEVYYTIVSSSKETIDIKDQPAGLYIVQIIDPTNGVKTISKIIKY